YRALAVVVVLAAMPLHQAVGQFGGMPGMPGSPGMGAPGGGFGAPSGPPPACQQLITMRDETQKHAAAINAASQRKASPQEACKLFKAFLSAEMRMIKAVEQTGSQCGVPPDMTKQMKA